jgi:hypothetical protein
MLPLVRRAMNATTRNAPSFTSLSNGDPYCISPATLKSRTFCHGY